MSDPMTAVEIEDVLSSIRRLVSEDLRPATRPAAPALVEKLILTPALRVVVQDRPEPAAAPVVAVRDRGGLGDVVASVGAAVTPPVSDWAEDWEPESGADDAVATWDDAVWDQAPSAEFEADPAAEFVSVRADGVVSDPVGADATYPDAMAEGGVGTAELPDGWTRRGRVDVRADDDEVGVDEDAGDPDWADAAEAQVIAALAEPEPDVDVGLAAELMPDKDFDADASDDAGEMHFDEQVLRDLVRDLIREELQGGLGERITRNIRKLVRAEIARALALHDLT